MSILKEFKEFAIKGNVIDMAIGVVVGGAFSKIVTSLVNDVIMPLTTFFIDQKFSYLALELNESNVIAYGNFIQTIVDFFIIAASIFMVVKVMNKLKRKKEVEAVVEEAKGPSTEELLAEIRDLLEKQNKQ